MVVAFAYLATMITPVLSGMSSGWVSKGSESGHRVSEGDQAAEGQAGRLAAPLVSRHRTQHRQAG
jgi:hypothetical protein